MKSHIGVTDVRVLGRRGLSLLVVAVALLIAPRSFATTITVNTTGASQSTKCNLTDAVKAAVTNQKVNTCPAGSSTSTDTIKLANTTYENYGNYIWVSTTGGGLVIQGTVAADQSSQTIIRAGNNGRPSSGGSLACPFPAAIFSGTSDLTIKDLDLQSNVFSGTTGICQYAGKVTMNNVVVGSITGLNTFGGGGLVSIASDATTHRTLVMTDTWFYTNEMPVNQFNGQQGGGIQANGFVDLTMTRGGVWQNIGGGLYWFGSDTAKLNLNSADISFNSTSGVGGGLYLYLIDSASVSISHCNFQQNSATQQGGAIQVDFAPNPDMVTISGGTFIFNNSCTNDSQQASFNSGWPVSDTVYCKGAAGIPGGGKTTVYNVKGSEWSTPPLRGDGTCVYP